MPSLSIEQYRVLKEIHDSQQRGLVPRLFFEIFQTIRENDLSPTVQCSYIQIYNEKIYDLFEDPTDTVPLILQEDKFGRVQVSGLSQYTVKHEWDCLNLLVRGEKNRIAKQSIMNQRPSRSHSVFQINLRSSKPDQHGRFKHTKFNLCDLAGSGKEDADSAEVKKLDKSLVTLGQVISALAKDVNASQPYPRFRESKLTRFLQDSLTVGSKTAVIATVSPSKESIEETISTMKFANKPKNELQFICSNERPAELPNISENLMTSNQGQEPEGNNQHYDYREEIRRQHDKREKAEANDQERDNEVTIDGQAAT